MLSRIVAGIAVRARWIPQGAERADSTGVATALKAEHRGLRWRAPRPRHAWGWRAGFTSLGVCLAFAAAAQGGDSQRATSSMAARKDALAAMPRDKLSEAQIEKIRFVVNKPSVYRRLPTQVIRCDPDLYLFVMNHPEVLANIWQLMGIEDVVLEPQPDGRFLADDGAGTRGMGEFLHRSFDTHLVYAEGRYDGSMFSKPVEGSSVVLLKSAYSREPDGHYYITVRLDVFIRLEHAGLDFLAKTFQPLVVQVADYNFIATTNFLQSLSRTAEVNPRGMRKLAENLTNLPPDVRAEFIATTAQVAERAAPLGTQRTSLSTPRIEIRQATRIPAK